jgi:hypothetical protein
MDGAENKPSLTDEEIRCAALLKRHGAEWIWHMTDEEYLIAKLVERRLAKERPTEIVNGIEVCKLCAWPTSFTCHHPSSQLVVEEPHD